MDKEIALWGIRSDEPLTRDGIDRLASALQQNGLAAEVSAEENAGSRYSLRIAKRLLLCTSRPRPEYCGNENLFMTLTNNIPYGQTSGLVCLNREDADAVRRLGETVRSLYPTILEHRENFVIENPN